MVDSFLLSTQATRPCGFSPKQLSEDSSEWQQQTTLGLKFKVDQQYVDLIQAALKEEESGITIETFRTTPFHLDGKLHTALRSKRLCL